MRISGLPGPACAPLWSDAGMANRVGRRIAANAIR